ncbi:MULTISPECIES: hypothetical protein [Pseudomonas]|uniref:Uncharacterized protein n=1 Tax=Pseudomonas fluorescens TaxID=294 RepID=A0A0F4T285_PSEFL|nr:MULTISPECIES: hypothetical protein [Pseudomonas]KJZ38478.1 hypothetical protein VC35_25905 [Pseudomonas fluorescens]MBI3906847.1 hypothetical protein [Pseudomonas fluorescens]
MSAQGVFHCICSSRAFARERHEQTAPVAQPSTDTPMQDQNDSTFISLTSDPLRNSPAVLKACTLKQGIDGPHWFFLTDDKVQMDLVWGRIGQIVPLPAQHSTRLIVRDAANRRWSKIRSAAPAASIVQRLQLLTMPVAGR